MMSNGFPNDAFVSNRSARAIALIGRYPLFQRLCVVAMLALYLGFAGLVTAQSSAAATGDVPANLVPSADAVLIFEFDAQGDQIYTCEAKPDDATAFVWTFQAPEAELFNRNGELVGSHFAGPTWQGNDGSAVIGEVVERADAPEAGAIPWLLLAANDHAGNGAFSSISYIQRLNTVGGVAPAEGCDADHEGEEVRVPYEATYAFFYAAAVAPATPAA